MLTIPKLECRPYFKVPGPEATGDDFWNVPDLCAAYKWPTGLPGGGVIAIVEFGGGWVQSDLGPVFCWNRPAVAHRQRLLSRQDGGTSPDPDTRGYDSEVALGIQVAAASYYVATGKPASIRVYWSEDIAKAVGAATSDGCDVCSISWGYDEAEWDPAAALDMEQAAAAATAAGMVVFAASGDNDSKDGGPNPANVDLPASCPHVIGWGGTTKTATTETVWNNDAGETDGPRHGWRISTLFTPAPEPGKLVLRMGRGGWFPIWQPMPILTPATTSCSTAEVITRAAGPVPLLHCTPDCLLLSEGNSDT